MFDSYYLPHQLNNPKRFLLFTVDEWAVLLLPLCLFQLFFDAWWLGLILSLSALVWLKRLKHREGPYYLSAWCYWYLPLLKPMRYTPPSHLRHWIG